MRLKSERAWRTRRSERASPMKTQPSAPSGLYERSSESSAGSSRSASARRLAITSSPGYESVVVLGNLDACLGHVVRPVARIFFAVIFGIVFFAWFLGMGVQY